MSAGVPGENHEGLPHGRGTAQRTRAVGQQTRRTNQWRDTDYLPEQSEEPVSVKIPPEVGRTLHYYPAASESMAGAPGPLAAKIVHVHSDSMVNLVVFDSNGNAHGKTSVYMCQPGEGPRSGSFCAWMPYQVEQAEKTATAKAIKDPGSGPCPKECEVKPSDPVPSDFGIGLTTTTTSSPAAVDCTTTGPGGDAGQPTSWLGKK